MKDIFEFNHIDKNLSGSDIKTLKKSFVFQKILEKS